MPRPPAPTTREGPPPRGGGEEWGGLPGGGEPPFPPGEPGTNLSRCGLAADGRGREGLRAQGPTPTPPLGLDPPDPEPLRPLRPLHPLQ